MTRFALCLAAVTLAVPAYAQERPGAGTDKSATGTGEAPDMTKMGPMSRPVTKEDKKGIDDLYKSMMDAFKAGDVSAAAENVDFPVIMLTDDATGTAKHTMLTREQWVAMMKPFVTNMPKDMKMSHKHTPYFLSDTLAAVIEETSVSGKTKGKWKGLGVVTLKDGKWKFKELAEAGWGDMPMPGQGKAQAPGRTPTTTTPAAPGR
jgi:hypothetical protein